MTDSQAHILLVEDDESLADWMADYLSDRDFKVTKTDRGDEAVKLIHSLNPDLVLLDGMLPGMDGLDVCKTVRSSYHGPIIMITARDEEVDEVLGLEMGADDFLVKPVRARALLTRIRSHLQKYQRIAQAEEYSSGNAATGDGKFLRFGQLEINAATRSAMFADLDLNISSKEFDALWYLAKNAGEIVSRAQLVSELRGFEYDGFDRSIDIIISKLRKKLDQHCEDTTAIKTIWGKGYLFAGDIWK